MTQSEVINYLKQHKNTWFNAKELKKYGSNTVLKKLRERGYVFYEIRVESKVLYASMFYYKYKEDENENK